MSIKYYANRVQETSTTTGSGNLVLGGAPLGYRTFSASIGADNKLTYYIYRQDTNFEWEIGVGYILSSGGVNQLVRERVVTSSNGNSLVGFTTGTKYVETIVSEDRANTSFINVEEKTSNFSPPYIPATYVVDASSSNIQVSLPPVTSQSDSIILGFVLNKTIGGAYEQINAIQLIPNGTETVAGTTGVDVSVVNDYLQIISVPSQSGWLLLDPIQDATFPFGNNGAVQFKYDNAFSGVDAFSWDQVGYQLTIGGSGISTADIALPASSGQTVIFNKNLYDNDFRVAGSGNSHLLYTDGGLNRVGINTSAVPDTLSINASSGSGITVARSGSGPNVLLYNTSPSGITTNNIVGSVVFSGLSDSGNLVQYGKISTIIENNSDSAEYSNITIHTSNNGAIEEIAVFSPSGVILGSNNQNVDGIIIGAGSNNEGNNIVGGYFNNVCGENCVVLGSNSVVSSGTFGGLIGSDHAVSGLNVWVIGGSGISVTGNNKTILGLDDSNYLQIIESGNFKYTTLTDNDVTFNIENISVLTSGINQNIAFSFINNSGVVKTGLLISSNISDVANTSEDSSFIAKILSAGSSVKILDLGTNNVVVGENSVSGTNIVFGTDNTIKNNNNIVVGSSINATGTNNVFIGHNIDIEASGTGITVVGHDNTCLSNGNLGVVIVGNGNESNEDYSIAIGLDNANSGLYSLSCGYLNGSHGDYSVVIGESNLVQSNYSVAIGRNNNLGATDIDASIFALGVGNSGNISNTGVIVGYLNELNGSGSIILGIDCSVSGSNNCIIGQSINFSGNNTTLVSGVNTNIYGGKISQYVDVNNNIGVFSTGISVNATKAQIVTGELKVINTDIGIIYQNSPVATGTSPTGLVLENNIIKRANGSGSSNLDSLTDVVITFPSNGQTLKFNGTNWVNDTAVSNLDSLTDVSVSFPSPGQVLKFNGSAWINDTDNTGGGGSSNSVNVSDLLPSSTVTLTDTDKNIQFLDGYTHPSVTVNLSTLNMVEGDEFYIRNISSDTSISMTIIDGYTSNTLCTLGGTGEVRVACHVVFDGMMWRLLMFTT